MAEAPEIAVLTLNDISKGRNRPMKTRSYHTVLIGTGIILTTMTMGCVSSKEVIHNPEFTLEYKLLEKGKPRFDLGGKVIFIAPFTDMRTDKVVYKWEGKVPRMIPPFVDRTQVFWRSRKGDDPGIWVANALCLELERVNADIDRLSTDARPASGNFICGRVNILKAAPYGWQAGGLIAAVTGTGYSATININLEIIRDGVGIVSKTYSIKKKLNSDAFDVIMVGSNAAKTIPKALELALRELIQTQIMADVDMALRDI